MSSLIASSKSLSLADKLAILADAAKYDASCASSGGKKRTSRDDKGGKGLGSNLGGMGICHAYAPDGRCISLLKILLTNSCVFDCHYCINRASSNVRRARFTAAEVVTLTLDFYRRNYIEGLFLSSGIIHSPDYTMEQILEVARSCARTMISAAISISKPSPMPIPLWWRPRAAMPTACRSMSSCPPSAGCAALRPTSHSSASRARWARCAARSPMAMMRAAAIARRPLSRLPGNRRR
jgi:hypothetical protein